MRPTMDFLKCLLSFFLNLYRIYSSIKINGEYLQAQKKYFLMFTTHYFTNSWYVQLSSHLLTVRMDAILFTPYFSEQFTLLVFKNFIFFRSFWIVLLTVKLIQSDFDLSVIFKPTKLLPSCKFSLLFRSPYALSLPEIILFCYLLT